MSSSIGLRWHERWRQRQVTAVSHWCRVACEETVISGKYGRSFTVIQTILTSMKCDAATNSCIDATMRICSNIMCHMPVALSHELFSELVHRNKLGKKYPLPCHLTAWVYLTTSATSDRLDNTSSVSRAHCVPSAGSCQMSASIVFSSGCFRMQSTRLRWLGSDSWPRCLFKFQRGPLLVNACMFPLHTL